MERTISLNLGLRPSDLVLNVLCCDNIYKYTRETIIKEIRPSDGCRKVLNICIISSRACIYFIVTRDSNYILYLSKHPLLRKIGIWKLYANYTYSPNKNAVNSRNHEIDSLMYNICITVY